MKINKKTMKRDEWSLINKKRYISENKKEYVVGLIIIDQVNKTLVVENEYETIKIIDNNYKWLSIAPKKENFFLTAMFDELDELIEIYFDINSGNQFDDLSNPYFYDMFLDIYITKDGKLGSLDFDELESAYENKIINKKEYNEAIDSYNKLFSYLKNNINDVKDLCVREFKRLNYKM